MFVTELTTPTQSDKCQKLFFWDAPIRQLLRVYSTILSRAWVNVSGWPSGLRRQTQASASHLWGFWSPNGGVGSNPTSDKTQFCSWYTCVFHLTLAFPPSFSWLLSILPYSVVGFFLPLKTVPTSSSTQAYTQEGPGIPGRVTNKSSLQPPAKHLTNGHSQSENLEYSHIQLGTLKKNLCYRWLPLPREKEAVDFHSKIVPYSVSLFILMKPRNLT